MKYTELFDRFYASFKPENASKIWAVLYLFLFSCLVSFVFIAAYCAAVISIFYLANW